MHSCQVKQAQGRCSHQTEELVDTTKSQAEIDATSHEKFASFLKEEEDLRLELIASVRHCQS